MAFLAWWDSQKIQVRDPKHIIIEIAANNYDTLGSSVSKRTRLIWRHSVTWLQKVEEHPAMYMI